MTTNALETRVVAMLAVREIADLELQVFGDHCLFTALLPIIERAIRNAASPEPIRTGR